MCFHPTSTLLPRSLDGRRTGNVELSIFPESCKYLEFILEPLEKVPMAIIPVPPQVVAVLHDHVTTSCLNFQDSTLDTGYLEHTVGP